MLASTTSGLTEYEAPVTTGRTYFFKVKTVNQVDRSALSSESLGMVAGSVPSEPLDLQLVSQTEF